MAPPGWTSGNHRAVPPHGRSTGPASGTNSHGSAAGNEFETALALAEFLENVRPGIEQPDPAPKLAAPETGRALWERIVDRVANYLTEMLDGRRNSNVPPYFP